MIDRIEPFQDIATMPAAVSTRGRLVARLT
jgi:hypothetical protein